MSKTILWLIGGLIVASIGYFVMHSIVLLGNQNRDGIDQQNAPAVNANIMVDAPVEGGVVRPGNLLVKGKARVFENQFNVRLSGGGKKIYEGSATTDAQDVGIFGNFEVSIPISAQDLAGVSDIKLEVFDYSAKDGSEIDKVIVNLSASL